jgi:Phage tail lysozyme
MTLYRTERQPQQAETVDSVYSALGFERTPGIAGVTASYNKGGSKAELHIPAIEKAAWSALNNFKQSVTPDISGSRVKASVQHDAINTLERALDSARKIELPTDAMQSLILGFIDYAIINPHGVSPQVRRAAADFGLAIGDDDFIITKATRIAELYTAGDKAPDTSNDIYRQQLTFDILNELGLQIEVQHVPSMIDDIAHYAKSHAPNMPNVTKTAASIALASAIIATPSIAHASDTNPVPVQVSVDIPAAAEPEAATAPAVPTTPELIAVTVEVAISDPAAPVFESQVVAAPVPNVSEQSVSVSVAVEQPTSDAPVAVEIIPDTNALNAVQAPVEVSVAPIESVVGVPVENPDGTIDIVQPDDAIVVLPEQVTETVGPDQQPLTDKQLAVNHIVKIISKEGDVDAASGLIVDSFGAVPDTTPGAAEQSPIVRTTNDALVARAGELESSFIPVMYGQGHTQAEYVNTTLTALSILQAATIDQTILQSQEVKDMMANIIRPTDPYPARLFDEYLAKVKAELGAEIAIDPSTIIDGTTDEFTQQTTGPRTLLTNVDPQYHAQIEMLYTYTLIAISTDAEQATAIQSMKDADAKAAAEKAAAEAAAKAQEQAANPQSAESEALQQLIDNTPAMPMKNKFITMKYFMDKGMLDYRAAGIVGNFVGESGMNPGSEQIDGDAKYMPQWEKDRLVAFEAWAAANNRDPYDIYTQLDYVWMELNSPIRGWALKSLNKSDNLRDAAAAFYYDFETPWISYNGTQAQQDVDITKRTNGGADALDAFHAEVNVVNEARAAAAKAEAERKANMGMNLEQARAFVATYLDSDDSVNYLGGAGRNCNGGPLSNCVSFSTYFINKFTDIQHFKKGDGTENPGDGKDVVANILARNPNIEHGHVPKPGAIFSTTKGYSTQFGHTGVILGVDEARGVVIIGEAGCSAAAIWDTAREKSLAYWTDDAIDYAYTNGLDNIKY